jgi:hypothetical protein
MKLRKGKEIVLAISDMQAPYQHPDTLKFLTAIKKKYKPTKVVCIGDSLDQHTLGKWGANPDLPGPADEFAQGLSFMREIYGVFPVATEVSSNHNSRYLKRLLEAGIPSAYIRKYSEIMEYPPGWEMVEDCEIDGVIYEHGTRFGGMNAPRQALQANWQSTVFGHHHSGGAIVYQANKKQMLFGMNCGCLIDMDRLAFAYAKDSRLKPTLGTGVINKGVPEFIPLIMNAAGRWVGKL